MRVGGSETKTQRGVFRRREANAQFDAKKQYVAERDAMRVFRHRWRPAAVERNLVGLGPVLEDD